MKNFMIALIALLAMAVSADAMSYEKAREQALFLTDKMAYELNLSEDQYEAAYEVNLDYLMSINSYDDLYGAYWRNRNLDLSYILLDWQYRAYCAASYFYRPLYWSAGVWHFGIYARYPHRHYFYFGRPHFYVSYRGGHSWRSNGGRSWYHGRTYGRPHREGGHGMKDRFDRGDYRKRGDAGYGRGSHRDMGTRHDGGNRRQDGRPGNGRFGGSNRGDNRQGHSVGNRGTSHRNGNGNRVTERESSTRSTVTNGSVTRGRNFGESRGSHVSGNRSTRPTNTFTPRNNGSTSGSRSFGGSHGNAGNSRPSSGAGSSRGHFGGHR